MNLCLSREHLRKDKRRKLCLGFKLESPTPFPATITIMLNTHVGVCVSINVCISSSEFNTSGLVAN